MNRFCINIALPTKTLKALHMGRMTKPPTRENQRAYELFIRIKEILLDEGISDYRPYFPLLPKGSTNEMMAGKTEVIGHMHRIFTFDFKATMMDKKEKERAKDRLTAFPQYFSWID